MRFNFLLGTDPSSRRGYCNLLCKSVRLKKLGNAAQQDRRVYQQAKSVLSTHVGSCYMHDSFYASCAGLCESCVRTRHGNGKKPSGER
jgi:hypothetical protein